MDLHEELSKEREELLLEYHRVEAVDRILKERAETVFLLKNQTKIDETNKCAKQTILRELRGGLFHKGLWRIERNVYHYFEELLEKLSNAEPKIKNDLQIIAKKVLLSAARKGTLYDLIEQENINWSELEQEVTELLKNITALIALLEEAEKIPEEQRQAIYAQIKERIRFLKLDVPIEAYVNPEQYYKDQSKNKRFVDFLALHWTHFDGTLQQLHNLIDEYGNYPKKLIMFLYELFPLIEKGLLSYEDFIKPLMDVMLEKPDLIDENIISVIKGMVSSDGFTTDTAKKFIALLQKIEKRYVRFYIGLMKEVIDNGKTVPFEEVLKIGNLFCESKYNQYFTEDPYLFFKFGETLLHLVKEKDINLLCGIDRGGRVLGFLSYNILSGLNMKIPCYFMFVNRRGEVTPYSKDFNKIIKNKNILIIDEFVKVGGTIRGAEKYLLDNGAKSVESVVFSSNIGGYNFVYTELPSWYYKKEYSGFVETGKFDNARDQKYMEKLNPEVRAALQQRAPIAANIEWTGIVREVRQCLKKMAEAIVIYLKVRK